MDNQDKNTTATGSVTPIGSTTRNEAHTTIDKLADKVVGIIGTGATAIQCIPHLGEAAKLRPVVIDESLTDLETLLLAREMGYTGVALKACKGQTQTMLQVLNNIYLFGMAPQQAVDAPRYRSYNDGGLLLDAGIPAEVRNALTARGHKVRVQETPSAELGGAQPRQHFLTRPAGAGPS